jgi:hypothetical protein
MLSMDINMQNSTDIEADIVLDGALFPTDSGGRRGPTPPLEFRCVCMARLVSPYDAPLAHGQRTLSRR